MICENCRKAADKKKPKLHEFCKGSTHCNCQHKTGQWVIKST